MRRFPLYAYPNLPHSFYSFPAEAPYHRPSSAAPPPAPTRRSVINVPVFGSTPSRPSSSPPQLHPPAIDPSSAANIIQSHFRGFCVRRHHPLVHLRSIANARKQLQELQSELEKPDFGPRVRASEKERLRFSESVMAIILRLDAVEGSMVEVRSQRKEATKMAIKLQDALDAIMMQKVEPPALNPSADADGMTSGDDAFLSEHSLPDVNKVQGEACAISEEGMKDINTTQEKPPTSADEVADKCMRDKDHVKDMVTENVSSLHPVKEEDASQEGEAQLSCFEAILPVKASYDAEQDMPDIIEENVYSDTTHEVAKEVKSGIDDLHLDADNNHMQNPAVLAKVYEEAYVDDMLVASHGSAGRESLDGSHTCMEVVQEDEVGLSQDVELCPGTPTAEEKCEYPNSGSTFACHNQLQSPSRALERMTKGNCFSDSKGYPALCGHARGEYSNVAHRYRCDEGNNCNEVKVQPSTTMAGTSSVQESAMLQQVSEDCRQLKSLVGKLLMQNKAQSNVLRALGERLEMLEHEQQLDCQRNKQKMREKRKLKKASKRSVRCRNCE